MMGEATDSTLDSSLRTSRACANTVGALASVRRIKGQAKPGPGQHLQMHLFTERFDLAFGERLAIHQLLDPAIKRDRIHDDPGLARATVGCSGGRLRMLGRVGREQGQRCHKQKSCAAARAKAKETVNGRLRAVSRSFSHFVPA